MELIIRPLVEISITEDKHDVISDLFKWLLAEKIYPTFTAYVGGGGLQTYFLPNDAARVVEKIQEIVKAKSSKLDEAVS
ncbi:MAG: hypothetical protein WC824_08245 [Bacteroidota bacterium]|jgi:hypothetical protein